MIRISCEFESYAQYALEDLEAYEERLKNSLRMLRDSLMDVDHELAEVQRRADELFAMQAAKA